MAQLHFSELEKTINYCFNDKELLCEALTHSSYANEHGGIKKHKCNERLEFLGDAVLSSVTAEYLFRKFSDQPEGDLTRMRAELVCEKALAEYSRNSVSASLRREDQHRDQERKTDKYPNQYISDKPCDLLNLTITICIFHETNPLFVVVLALPRDILSHESHTHIIPSVRSLVKMFCQ